MFDPDAPALPGSGIYGLDVPEDEASVKLLPVPFAPTQSYGRGAEKGPQAILTGSHQVDLFDLETGHPYGAGICLLDEPMEISALHERALTPAQKIIDAGSPDGLEKELEVVNKACSAMNELVLVHCEQHMGDEVLVGVLGGDHSVPLGNIIAHARRYPGLGILHLDAHADLREAYEGFTYSHASIMERALAEAPGIERLVQVGLRDIGVAEYERVRDDERIEGYFEPEIAKDRLKGRLLDGFERTVSYLPQQVYLSFDIDGLDPALCPATGTPVPGGLSLSEVSFLLEAVVESGRRIVGFDLCEVAQTSSPWDGNVGARLLYKMIGWALRSRQS